MAFGAVLTVAVLGACGGTEEPAQDDAGDSSEAREDRAQPSGSAATGTPAAINGPRIAFSRSEGTRQHRFADIYVMKPDGSEQTQLTDSTDAADEGPTWSPDGRRIAFTRWEGRNADIYVMAADGSDQTRLTDNPGFYGPPAFSPDGQRIAFGSGGGNGEDDGGIYVANADGSDLALLTSGRHGGPTWSPDGERIAFVRLERDAAASARIYVVNAVGTDLRRLTAGEEPAWLPDGARILFVRQERDEVYSMSADGSDVTRLTAGPEFDDVSHPRGLALSPDGRRVAFVSLQVGSDSYAIWVMNADGSDPIRLTARAAPHEPTWSPDGERIAFAGERDGPGIYVMNADGSDQAKLPRTLVNDLDPAWSPARAP